MPATDQQTLGVVSVDHRSADAGAAPDRRSTPDLRSIDDRLSPTAFFFSSVRMSTPPFRRSLPERRSTFDRRSSIVIADLPNSIEPAPLAKQAVNVLKHLLRRV